MKRSTTKTSGIMVCAETQRDALHGVTFELLGKAAELAKKKNCAVSCLVIGANTAGAYDVFKYGADRLILAQRDDLREFNQEITAKIVSHIIEEYKPEIVIAPATTSGRTYMPMAAAALRTGLTADCTALDIDEESGLLLQTRPAIGGNIMATIKTPGNVPQMATVRPKTFGIPEARQASGEVIKPTLPKRLFESEISDVQTTYCQENDENIQEKEVVISGGLGLRRPENFSLLKELAKELDGAVGASRPVVEAKWAPYSRQVGLSGKVVSPKLYVAAGISGAVQHIAGMQTAQKIVSVNADGEAPICRLSDIVLCGDLAEIIPKLTRRIAEEKNNEREL